MWKSKKKGKTIAMRESENSNQLFLVCRRRWITSIKTVRPRIEEPKGTIMDRVTSKRREDLPKNPYLTANRESGRPAKARNRSGMANGHAPGAGFGEGCREDIDATFVMTRLHYVRANFAYVQRDTLLD